MLQSMGWQRVGQDWATQQLCASGPKVTVSVPVTTSDHERVRVNCTIPGSCEHANISAGLSDVSFRFG